MPKKTDSHMSAIKARSPEPTCNTGPANADNAAPPPIIIALPSPDAVPASFGLIANMPAVAFGMLIPLPRPTNVINPKKLSALPYPSALIVNDRDMPTRASAKP